MTRAPQKVVMLGGYSLDDEVNVHPVQKMPSLYLVVKKILRYPCGASRTVTNEVVRDFDVTGKTRDDSQM